jgi:2-polyprenyl-3-methyl-5-hydroxy-6-metoxy-1,4-benzoquinol methylase
MEDLGTGYNARLFEKRGIRSFFHNSRFKWLFEESQRLNINKGSILELGCFDGKTINYMPFVPKEYVGYDANWEGGLDEAEKLWKHNPEYKFKFCDSPALFNPTNELFDYCISMETLEHLPLAYSDEFLQKLASSTKTYGFFSIPNEQGILCVLKYLIKITFLTTYETYSLKELWFAFIGHPEKVKRNEGLHKGFSYKQQIRELQRYFDIVSVKGIPFKHLPLSLNFTIGIVVKKKEN